MGIYFQLETTFDYQLVGQLNLEERNSEMSQFSKLKFISGLTLFIEALSSAFCSGFLFEQMVLLKVDSDGSQGTCQL